MRSFLLIMIALLGTQVAASNTVLRTHGTLSKLGHLAVPAALSLALATAPLHQATAQGKAVEELTPVVADDPAYRHGTMLLRVSTPPAEDEEEGVEYAFHLAFIGLSEAGNSLLVGRERQSGHNVGEKIAEASNVSLYGWDGRLGDDLTVMVIDTFEDITGDNIYDVVALEVEGINLAANYPPLALDDGFPYAEERDLEVLSYRLRYSPVLNEEELAAELAEDGFTLSWLKCNSVPHAKLAIIGNGFTTCGILDNDLSNGASLIHDSKLVALQSLDSPTLRNKDDQALVWLATDIPDRAVIFSQTLSELSTHVNPAGKLPTTWAAIKAKAAR